MSDRNRSLDAIGCPVGTSTASTDTGDVGPVAGVSGVSHMGGGVRLAVWSGPRNISTALMRSWENRPDCRVVDEPLYPYHLAESDVDHPGRDKVLATGETSWEV